jgi:hypothetical protein
MADDLLSRILGEIRERRKASRAAVEESQRVGRVLAALEGDGKQASAGGLMFGGDVAAAGAVRRRARIVVRLWRWWEIGRGSRRARLPPGRGLRGRR